MYGAFNFVRSRFIKININKIRVDSTNKNKNKINNSNILLKLKLAEKNYFRIGPLIEDNVHLLKIW